MRSRSFRAGIILILSLASPTWAQQVNPAGQETLNPAPGFKEFSTRVQAYVKVLKNAESGLPALKKTNDPHEIEKREKAILKRIRALRKKARRGDIFTPTATSAFQAAINSEFAGPHAASAKRTIQEGEPLKEFEVKVNQLYPDALPYTTVPPTLLLKFPTLPEELSFRLLGSDLLLVDQKTRLIVDYMRSNIPVSGG